MSKEILQDIIADFKIDKFIRFFRHTNRYFRPQRESLNQYNDESFSEGIKLGEVNFNNEAQDLIVCAFNSTKSLSERSGKRAQYEKAKKILKELDFDSGIFIFYDQDGNFRFSLIYFDYLGKGRHPSTFRRFTYFVSPNLTNKTFLQRIGEGDFSSLEKVKDAFSVEKVTEDFYKDIANWYFWAVQNSRFPKDAEEEGNGRNMAIIRLITRLIFIWFMRVRGLVPDSFFNESRADEYLNDLSPQSSSYYKAILQNLFFATLSTKREERNFRSEIRGIRGYNPDFGNQYTYRYHKLFKNPENIKDYFGEIPFLNGGIFECLDDKPNGIYIDGFSDTKKNQPIVPNFLFFSGESNADLNTEYGTKNKNYKVRGIINTLSYYNFTINENDPNDAEVALDPELLGKVFENLLASFNPETATTARKMTGSYYTPREIVDYMVTESLIEYFKVHFNHEEELDKKLETLFNGENDKNPFNEQDNKKIVELIDKLRIVDPAVGSGAFPMAILNKLVYILSKLDPENLFWKEAQLDVVHNIPDPKSRKDAINNIEKNFEEKNVNYFRKLYLIQKCIYGVDIQQIAVEIAKLRFFISLLVDEKIDKENIDGNWGIEPLPNLDFKIMQGNSLISEFLGIDFDNSANNQDKKGQRIFGFKEDDDRLIRAFEQKKIDYQNETDRNKKNELQKEIENLMVKIFEAKLQKHYTEVNSIIEKAQGIPNLKNKEEFIKKEKSKFYKKQGFDLENIEEQFKEFSSKKKKRPFFPWKLYFAEVFIGDNPGFDIVIANPPYLDYRKIDRESKHILRSYKCNEGSVKPNLYIFFIERSLSLLKTNGVLIFINPNYFLSADYAYGIRKILLSNAIVKFLLDVSRASVFTAGTYTFVWGLKKKLPPENYRIRLGRIDKLSNTIIFENYGNLDVAEVKKHKKLIFPLTKSIKLITKIESNSKELREFTHQFFWGTSQVGYGKKKINVQKFLQLPKDRRDQYCKIIQTADIKQYRIEWSGEYIPKSIYSKSILEKFNREKLVIARITKKIQAAIDTEGCCVGKSSIILDSKLPFKLLIGLLNSNLVNFWFREKYHTLHMAGDYLRFDIPYLKQIPIPKTISDPRFKNLFIDLVDKIIAITKGDDYLENSSKQTKVRDYEKQINQLVYNLYGLTRDEIKIIEGNSQNYD